MCQIHVEERRLFEKPDCIFRVTNSDVGCPGIPQQVVIASYPRVTAESQSDAEEEMDI